MLPLARCSIITKSPLTASVFMRKVSWITVLVNLDRVRKSRLCCDKRQDVALLVHSVYLSAITH